MKLDTDSEVYREHTEWAKNNNPNFTGWLFTKGEARPMSTRSTTKEFVRGMKIGKNLTKILEEK